MKKTIAALAFAVASFLHAQDEPAAVNALRNDVTVLADDRMEGRGLGTKGIELAGDWIEARLRKIELKPGFGGSYRQQFPVKTGVALGEKNELSGVAREDWTPLAFSSSGKFDGDVVFVGYGIEAPALGYNDYEGVDLKGKVALMLRYEPQERDESSKFDGKKPSRWSAMRYKVLKARERGAVAVVFTTGPIQDEGKDKLPQLINDGPESPAGLPVVQVKTSVAQKWLTANGVDLAQWQKDVDSDVRPRSKALMLAGEAAAKAARQPGNVEVNATYANTVNLAGVLPGRGRLANEVVVLGAHYDHLGWGGQGSMKPNDHSIHNGADDNASGTVAVLHAVDRLAKSLEGVKNRRAIYVTLFSAEERGLGGSGFFVNNSPVPMTSVVAMINLDMVGMLEDNRIVAFGTESAVEWAGVIASASTASALDVKSNADGYGPSDQTSFYASKVPVLHFFTGAHERYHTAEDDPQHLNYAGMLKVVDFTTRVVDALARGSVSPKYARTATPPAQQGDSRGYGSYLGTVPDYAAMEAATGGVKLSDVRPGSPAEKAGIRGGDTIFEMGGTRIENIQDMTFALQDHKPGDTIDVVVLRAGERVKLRATLGSRKAESAPGGGGHGASALEIKAGKPFEKVFEGEKHLQEIRQLTFGGENAEAYFSPDGKKLVYQATTVKGKCDQQFVLDLTTGESKMVSSGKGRTTCGYFSYPAGDRVIYASTESGGVECPTPPDMSLGYVWPIYPSFELYTAKTDGSDTRRLTQSAGYDAEATWCHQGGKFVFTSTRDGDLDLYTMDDAGNVKRLTTTPGYDGGAFFSADCKEIVWRANRPEGDALTEYRRLLGQGLIRPNRMELFVMNADGTNQRQITNNGKANFCPYFTPDGKKIIFASNLGDTRGREFDLWMIPKSGGEPERITNAPGFDGFPMFSPDGKYLVFASNRAMNGGFETNLFIAKWVE